MIRSSQGTQSPQWDFSYLRFRKYFEFSPNILSLFFREMLIKTSETSHFIVIFFFLKSEINLGKYFKFSTNILSVFFREIFINTSDTLQNITFRCNFFFLQTHEWKKNLFVHRCRFWQEWNFLCLFSMMKRGCCLSSLWEPKATDITVISCRGVWGKHHGNMVSRDLRSGPHYSEGFKEWPSLYREA